MSKLIQFDRDAIIEKRMVAWRKRRGRPQPEPIGFMSLGLHCALMDDRINRDAELDALTARITELEGREILAAQGEP